MRFEPNEDQAAFLAVLEQMTSSEDASWKTSPDWGRFDWSQNFDSLLEDNGFYDCAVEETLGAVAAADLIHRLNTLPICVESAASSMLRPLCAADLPRPVAVIEGDLARPTRFLAVAKSVIHIDGGDVRVAVLAEGSVSPAVSLFAYPMGVLTKAEQDWQPVAAGPETIRDLWRIAIAAELAGSLAGGLAAVLIHVRDRHQFGRALGSFQAIQHRLAEAAITIDAARLMVLKAAQSGDPLDATTALAYVQNASTEIVYDFHQFMGAMGLTLEHPLHRWTYRAKLLRSSLGGAHGNLALVAERRWGSQ